MNLPIYIVSLKRDIERRNKINDVFHRLNINFDFFDAIDAKDPQNKEIIDKIYFFKRSFDAYFVSEAIRIFIHSVYRSIVFSPKSK